VHEGLKLEEPDRVLAKNPDRPLWPSARQDPGTLGLSAELTALVRDGWAPASKYRSRSEAQQAVANGLVNAGHDDQTIRTVLSRPDYGISARTLEGSPRKGPTDIERCIRKARASHTAKAQPNLPPGVELHRKLRDAAMPPWAWPIVFEIMATTDYATGLSLVTAPSLARRFGIGPATVYRALSQLRAAGFLDAVPLARPGPRYLSPDARRHLRLGGGRHRHRGPQRGARPPAPPPRPPAPGNCSHLPIEGEEPPLRLLGRFAWTRGASAPNSSFDPSYHASLRPARAAPIPRTR
jgi:hypothetical protein